MKKQFLAVSLILLSSLSFAASNLIELEENYYLLRDSIKRVSASVIKAKTKAVIHRRDEFWQEEIGSDVKKAASIVIQSEYNCNEAKVRELVYTMYDRSGNPINVETYERAKFKAPKKGSVGEKELLTACKIMEEKEK